MSHLQNNEKIRKPFSKEKSEEDSIDFHLEIIKKIDKIFKEHENETLSKDTVPEQQTCNFSEEPPAEIRTPLNKKVKPSEVKLEKKPDDIFTKKEITPEEFKTEFPITNNPYFKFINTLNSTEDIIQIKDKDNARIEIIDIGSLMAGDAATQPKKVEIISTGRLSNKKSNNVFVKAMNQPEETEEKAKIYYLKNSKRQKEKQSYIPVDFEDKAKKLKEKEKQEEQKRTEKEQREKERETKKLKKLEAKKAKIEEKKKQREAKKALKEKKAEKQKTKEKKHDEEKHEKALPKKDEESEPTLLNEDIKKLLVITDNLLGELPEEVIDKFAQSEDFELYQRVLSKYKIK